jgi:hypothetical protein
MRKQAAVHGDGWMRMASVELKEGPCESARMNPDKTVGGIALGRATRAGDSGCRTYQIMVDTIFDSVGIWIAVG